MATRIRAINALRPKLRLNPTVKLGGLVDFIGMRTGANRGMVQLVLAELNDAVTCYNLQGTPVKIDGLGICTPTIDLGGKFDCGHRADPEILRSLNAEGPTGANC